MSLFETLMNIIAGALVWSFTIYIIIKIARTAYEILFSGGD